MSDHQLSFFPLNTPGCYCTGACRQPGGVCPNAHTVTVQQSWRCSGCGNQWSPYVVQCPMCAPRGALLRSLTAVVRVTQFAVTRPALAPLG